jgi:hypothetical protein
MFSALLLVGVILVGFTAAITLGSQAYFLGEMSKPIHERNWNSEKFDSMAEALTGETVDSFNRQPGFEVGDAFSSGLIAQQ